MPLRRTLALLLTAVVAIAADDKKSDNPGYTDWAKFKPGTTLTTRRTEEIGGVKRELVVTRTLVAVTDDKLVIEAGAVGSVGGKEDYKQAAKRSDVPRTADGAVDLKRFDPKAVVEKGTKKVKVGDTEFECQWFKLKGEAEGEGKSGYEGEVWLCASVPGGVVKRVHTTALGTITTGVTGLTFAKLPAAEDKPKPPARLTDNPQYVYWAKFKPGTALTLKFTSASQFDKLDGEVVTTLVEVTDDKLVIEVSSTTTSDGKPVDKQPAKKVEVPRKRDPNRGADDPKQFDPERVVEVGTKKVKIGDTEVECQWYKLKFKLDSRGGAYEVEGEVWYSDEVPGALVKRVTKSKEGSMIEEVAGLTVKK